VGRRFSVDGGSDGGQGPSHEGGFVIDGRRSSGCSGGPAMRGGAVRWRGVASTVGGRRAVLEGRRHGGRSHGAVGKKMMRKKNLRNARKKKPRGEEKGETRARKATDA
jgi:hypothetical protein